MPLIPPNLLEIVFVLQSIGKFVIFEQFKCYLSVIAMTCFYM